jgi:hypothetical protein
MRSPRLPFLFLAAVGAFVLGSQAALAQNYGSYRMGGYVPSNYGTPGGSRFPVSNYGNSAARASYGMPNPNYMLPNNYGALNAAVATPVGALPLLPGARVTGNPADIVYGSVATANTGVQQAANVAGTVQQLLPPGLLAGALEMQPLGTPQQENPETQAGAQPSPDLTGAVAAPAYIPSTAATAFSGLTATASARSSQLIPPSQGHYAGPGSISTPRSGYFSAPVYSSSYSSPLAGGYYRGP